MEQENFNVKEPNPVAVMPDEKPTKLGGWLYSVRYAECENPRKLYEQQKWENRCTEVRAYGVHAAEKMVEEMVHRTRPGSLVMAIECAIIGAFAIDDDDRHGYDATFKSFKQKWGEIKPCKFALHFLTQGGFGLVIVSARELEEAIQFARVELVESGQAKQGYEVCFSDSVIIELADANTWPVGQVALSRFTPWLNAPLVSIEKRSQRLALAHQLIAE